MSEQQPFKITQKLNTITKFYVYGTNSDKDNANDSDNSQSAVDTLPLSTIFTIALSFCFQQMLSLFINKYAWDTNKKRLNFSMIKLGCYSSVLGAYLKAFEKWNGLNGDIRSWLLRIFVLKLQTALIEKNFMKPSLLLSYYPKDVRASVV